ncbi:CocE/NonD family hydrolase [Amycolatopsis sp. CA-126428]|uniref:CocE/NonD family hydrolase n=1 Tax=Amycolatopsis sp. CA-126428 TaxID=2073158 RepID=UPI0018EC4474|nr:CocE/NonD family hydrolase [Amycolatopsis sp. CA-126428]
MPWAADEVGRIDRVIFAVCAIDRRRWVSTMRLSGALAAVTLLAHPIEGYQHLLISGRREGTLRTSGDVVVVVDPTRRRSSDEETEEPALSDDQKIYMPSQPLEAGNDRYGLLSDFEPGTRTLETGFQIAPPFRPLPVDVVLEKDIAVTLRDGVTTYVDVLRPAGTEKVPVIVAFSPYGKGQGTSPSVMGVFGLVGLDNGIVSGLAKFEGPDPAYWCAHGYAICNPDIRGVANCEGDSVLWDRQEGRDCHDLVEWLAAQEWCSGKVAMSGTSYLAVSQWFTAAEQPPHLAAINPWEGVSDVYRDLVMRGGMPDTGFARQLRDYSYWGKGRKEDILAEAERYPLMTELWENKIPQLDQITVPAYVVASYSNTLHTAGTFRAWRRIGSEEKWLRIHNGQEWPDYYDEANREDLRRFFDHYLKGEDNGWEQTPRVRYSLLDLEGGDQVNIAADEFPPNDVTLTKYYLDGRSRVLTTTAPSDEATASYDVAANPDLVSFVTRFDRETVLVGYPKAHLWVEAAGADDMDLFVLVQKLDAYGTPLQQFTVPNQTAMAHDLTERGASILRYKGSDGRLRVSLRHLDETLSTDAVPVHSFDRVEKLSPGEIAEIEIDLLPVGLEFHPGEQLRFVISGRPLIGPMMPRLVEYVPANNGQHVVHTGGDHASYLQLPVWA